MRERWRGSQARCSGSFFHAIFPAGVVPAKHGFVYSSGAGAETTTGSMYWWMLAMVAFPETQKRAQAELDTVVGRSRIPSFSVLPSLPYLRGMVKEVLRWRSVLPVGIPHCAIEDDWYEGMFIPKGT